MNKKAIISLGCIAVAALVLSGCGTTPTNTTPTNSATNSTNSAINDNTASEENINGPDVTSQTEAVYIGKVFLKGYKTPSESYGILTDDGSEIGFGKYDSMKEQFRAYIGDRIKVKFSDICRSSHEDCCRTLFPFCGTVTTWEPL